jgi:hypothetical protein
MRSTVLMRVAASERQMGRLHSTRGARALSKVGFDAAGSSDGRTTITWGSYLSTP